MEGVSVSGTRVSCCLYCKKYFSLSLSACDHCSSLPMQCVTVFGMCYQVCFMTFCFFFLYCSYNLVIDDLDSLELREMSHVSVRPLGNDAKRPLPDMTHFFNSNCSCEFKYFLWGFHMIPSSWSVNFSHQLFFRATRWPIQMKTFCFLQWIIFLCGCFFSYSTYMNSGH